MDQYPTEEEEYELMYGDELEAMEDMDIEMTLAVPGSSKTTTKSSEPPRASTSMSHHTNHPLDSPHFSQIDGESPLRSPALSLIPRHSSTIQKRLFGTPGPGRNDENLRRTSSTPFPGPSSSSAGADPLAEIQNLGLKAQKRRLDALFGDIQDIEDDVSEIDCYRQTKKAKTEDELDRELIERILDARKRFQAVIHPTKSNDLARAEALHRFKMQNLSYSLPKWPFVTVVRNDMERVYVRFHSEEFETSAISEINCFKDGYNGLLGDAKEKIWREANEIVNKRIDTSKRAIEPDPEAPVVVAGGEGSDLWVEKYRPHRYIDLLSDETTNRSLLQWLTLWDKIVFGREPKQKKDTKQLSSFNKKTGRFETNGGWKRKGRGPTLNTDLDENGCPVQKIALLCGPPGLGKTTLAHTIARHAGYVVREVNASDDRSPEAFRIALESGTQMRSVLNADGRPNCIVLDEIDGAPAPTVDFLLRFISGNVAQKGSSKGKGGKDNKFILRRPIICICNDMYVPALRQLRQVAFVVNFPPTESSRLAERLLLISKQEKVHTDLTSMLALAEKSGNDVRSCLSMLQFHSSTKKRLQLTDVLKCNVGQKDRHRGLFEIWSAIFQIQRPRKTLTADDNTGGDVMVTLTDMSPATRMLNILDIIHTAGDHERLMQGVFENYLHQKMPDPNMTGAAEAGEWFCFNDRVQQMIHHQQNYSIYPYLAFGFISWHFLFAGLAWPKINFGNQGFKNSQKLATCKLILTGLRKGLSAQLKGIGEGPTVLLDTVPLLKHVISPSLRSVSLQLLTSKEKSDLTHTVEVMADFGLNYIQLKSAEGTYQYQLDPDIEQLGHFQDVSTQSLSYFGKQIVAREVELERMRRAQPKASTTTSMNGNAKTAGNKRDASGSSRQKEAAKTPGLPNHLQTLKPKQVAQKIKQVVCKDFFGRITTKETTLSVQEGGTDTIVKSPIWYRYKEGFNNAVRKDVTLHDLM
ncbi:chromosome transmission fidelity protein 18 homolog [Toxorhynchites rutilus septentrionalis]|uniref:chromosome transmission fidelity protein 18 homolog n=1 Tax=Toxorhynchites rutilus septentrionalis TaxID=329112 RepID=UPI00247A3FC1|nr:chromosome transmission fidelity protein 18 homolog [Toxorhynchites rutilus septentrionalis]